MSADYQKQIEQLAEIIQLLANIGPGDQDGIMQAGAKLEDAIEGFGQNATQLNRLVELAWEGIKHLYARDDFFMTVKMATMQAVNTIREYALTSGDIDVRDFERACDIMQKALKGDGESADKIIELPPETPVDTDSIPVTPVSRTVEAVSLDEVNAAFMKLDVETLTPDLLRDFYEKLDAAASQYEDEVGALLQQAVTALTEAPDPETMIASVGQKLEEASEAKMMLDFAGESASGSPAAETMPDLDENGTVKPSSDTLSADNAEAETPSSPESTQTDPVVATTGNHTVSASETAAANPDPVESPATSPSVQPPAPQSPPPAPRTGSAVIDPAAPATPDFEVPGDADTDLLQEFYTECTELIGIAEEALLELENNPDDDELINQVFRAFHTIKGTAAFLGLVPVSEFAHHVETLLSMVRDNEIGYTNQAADITLDSLDTIKSMVEEVPTLAPGKLLHIPPAFDALKQRLIYVEEHGKFDGLPDVAASTPSAAAASVERAGGSDVEEAPKAPEPSQPATKATSTEDESVMDDWSEPEETEMQPVAPEAAIKSAAPAATNGSARSNGSAPKAEAESTVRVNTERLDRLIDMVGELVIAHSVVAQDHVVASDSDLLRKVTHTTKILRELQDISLKLRMVPLKATFQKMNRLVRDLSRKAGKQVAFKTVGDDTEIDRNMVDIINEPLIHMLRNSLDHGVETPEQRAKTGKDPVANVYLRAYQQGGKVVIEIEDDGRGLNTEKIYAKALEKGIADPNRKYTDHEIHNFIFLPGFSTADVVTDLSGRGVGMDVVRRSIDKLQGKVDVSSETGMGSMVTIELPFTLAITDGMLVRVGHQRFIVPTINIDMTFRPDENANFTIMGDSENVMFRGSSIPIIRLHRMFNVPDAAESIQDGVLMVINSNRQKYALLIDEVLGQQHLVGKSISMPVKLQNISGGAILGDGQVGLILDTVALVS